MAERNELGQFKPGHKLSPEHLEKLAEGRKVARENKGEIELKMNLLAMGFTEPFPADILTLGRIFVEGKSGTVSAYNKLLALSPTRREELGLWDPDSGEPCPTCDGASGDTMSKLIAKHPGLLDKILGWTEEKLTGDIENEDPE